MPSVCHEFVLHKKAIHAQGFACFFLKIFNPLLKFFKEIVGVKNTDLANHILHVAAAALIPFVETENGRFMNVMLQFLYELKPQNAIEAQLGAKAAVLYAQGMSNFQRMGSAKDMKRLEAYSNISVKLLRVHNETIETLNRYRRGGEQKVTVTHAVVAGQAVVNHFTGVGATQK